MPYIVEYVGAALVICRIEHHTKFCVPLKRKYALIHMVATKQNMLWVKIMLSNVLKTMCSTFKYVFKTMIQVVELINPMIGLMAMATELAESYQIKWGLK